MLRLTLEVGAKSPRVPVPPAAVKTPATAPGTASLKEAVVRFTSHPASPFWSMSVPSKLTSVARSFVGSSRVVKMRKVRGSTSSGLAREKAMRSGSRPDSARERRSTRFGLSATSYFPVRSVTRFSMRST